MLTYLQITVIHKIQNSTKKKKHHDKDTTFYLNIMKTIVIYAAIFES